MTGAEADFEDLLRRALAPVEPPADLPERLERTLENLAAVAQEELEAWELSAMTDPRKWARPAAAVVVGGSAGAALVVLRARRQARRKAREEGGVRNLAEKLLREAVEEALTALDPRDRDRP